MIARFVSISTLLIILFVGCGGDKLTTPEDQLDLTAPELAPLLNTQAGQQFAADPHDINKDGVINVLDLMLVAQHFGEAVDVEGQGNVGEGVVLQLVNTPGGGKIVQVSGTGSAFGEPDIVILSLGVSVERASVQEARDEAAEAMQGVIDSLKANGVVDQDVQTQQFSIQQQFDFNNGQRLFRGYRVTNTVSAKLRNLDAIGQAIDDAAEAGGDLVQINSIQFGIDDTTELQQQARIAAMRNAQAKAQTLASEGGVTLGKPLSITEGGFFAQSQTVGRDVAADEAFVSTPIETGQLQVTVSVNVIYEIE